MAFLITYIMFVVFPRVLKKNLPLKSHFFIGNVQVFSKVFLEILASLRLAPCRTADQSQPPSTVAVGRQVRAVPGCESGSEAWRETASPGRRRQAAF